MIDTTLSSFERDVIEASMEVPVIVDFWAPWCGPCKALGPLLEKLEREYGGRFKLVNVNADTNPELVASFNLKSIPYAVAFVDGGRVRLKGAGGEDLTAWFPEIRALGPALAPVEAVLDGEIVAFDGARPDAKLLDRRIAPKDARRAAERTPVQYLAYDLLWLEGAYPWDRLDLETQHRIIAAYSRMTARRVETANDVPVSPRVSNGRNAPNA